MFPHLVPDVGDGHGGEAVAVGVGQGAEVDDHHSPGLPQQPGPGLVWVRGNQEHGQWSQLRGQSRKGVTQGCDETLYPLIYTFLTDDEYETLSA